jgi:hypothetical protein
MLDSKASSETGTGHRMIVEDLFMIVVIHLSYVFRLYGVNE